MTDTTTSSAASAGPRAAAHLQAGSHVFPLEADRIHVIGSGERAQVRLIHLSIAAAHATVCAHDGRLIVEDLGTPGGTWLGDERVVGEREVPDGAQLRVGEVTVRLSHAAPLPVPAHPPHAPREPSFAQVMGDELRRAPWFALSVLLHAILFLVLYLLIPASRPPERGVVRLAMQTGSPQADDIVDVEAVELEIEVPDPPEPVVEPIVEPADEITHEPVAAEPSAPAEAPFEGIANPGVSLFAKIGGGAGNDVLRGGDGGGALSGGFRRTVSGLRESGLEIVFVLDSTGSMGAVLDATKRRMVRTLEVLHALVPDARVGVVAYRDHGPGESYVTRNLGLGRDLYRSLNFMQTIDAAGGGDRPEAVLDGLKDAIGQTWREGAKRVVVVVGDAPAHRWSEDEIDRLVGRFARDGKGFVHTITTATELLGDVSRDTRASFERIAKAGRGICVPSENDDSILLQVLTLAIGAEFRDSVDEVFRIVEQRKPAFSSRARDAIRSRDADAIADQLRRPPIEDGFVQALIDDGDPALADALIRALKLEDLPPAGRNAAAYALQRMLSLSAPPVDPLAPARIDARIERDLRAAAARRR